MEVLKQYKDMEKATIEMKAQLEGMVEKRREFEENAPGLRQEVARLKEVKQEARKNLVLGVITDKEFDKARKELEAAELAEKEAGETLEAFEKAQQYLEHQIVEMTSKTQGLKMKYAEGIIEKLKAEIATPALAGKVEQVFALHGLAGIPRTYEQVLTSLFKRPDLERVNKLQGELTKKYFE